MKSLVETKVERVITIGTCLFSALVLLGSLIGVVLYVLDR